MQTVKKSWQIIEGVLWENAHSVHRALRRPATDAQLARLTKAIPAKLPGDFLRSLKIHDGLRDSDLGSVRLFDYYGLLPITSILKSYAIMCDLQAEFHFRGGDEADPAVRNDAHWRPGWVPFMDADGDKFVLDLDPAPGGSVGQVFEWSNTGAMPLRVLAPTFGAWLAWLAEMLAKRRFRLNEFGDICLERPQWE